MGSGWEECPAGSPKKHVTVCPNGDMWAVNVDGAPELNEKGDATW